MIDERTADRIADAITAMRPTWDRNRIKGIIGDRRLREHRQPTDVAAALAWIAMDPKTTAPNRVFEAGPWWGTADARAAESRLPRLPDPSDCNTCGRPKHDADRICDDYAPVNSRPPSTTGAEIARAALKAPTKGQEA